MMNCVARSELSNIERKEKIHMDEVKLYLCLTKHHAMKMYWGVEVKLHEFFDLGPTWR
jgi:hypothetical protein